ncbi:hypothetical protein [Bradyrhizobium zhanjiangense]|uniref:PAS domain-containing protein n=1 Tax=Bradyrhizobium zhanjiangense TaxID=1325107 RepID=A0ABY0DHU5_9BRAD|nr:hypothetical protein [Bradyrhizobium zhanjiangense]RXG91607.1 hypothetical protein EAS62_24315 [Bradyrhizobium zhanjiangense]
MSERQLRKMIDLASDFCDRTFDVKGEIAPSWHAITATGDRIIEPHPMFFGKDLAAALIRALFDLRDVVRYVYVGEAWTLNRIIRPEEQEEIFRKGISEHPDRVEVVQIQGEDSQYGQIIAARNIIRPEGRKPYLGPLQFVNDLPFIPQGAAVQSSGRLVGMLPVRGTRQ